MLFILHSGQTGIERGAHEGARGADLGIAGFMPLEQRDELGPLPAHVTQRLTACPERGHRPALRATISIASAAILVVPHASSAERFPAMLWVLQRFRAHRLPFMVCDPDTSVAEVASWTAHIPETCGSRRLVVTGPRATRWTEGETIARRFVTAIAAIGASPGLAVVR